MKKLLLLLSAVVFACSGSEKDTELSDWERQAGNVTIIRDNFGVPHVYGKTDADAVFGLLYAQCEDDFPRVERNYIWAIGRLAEVEGEDMIYSDLRARLFMTEKEAVNHYNNSPEWLKKLCRAYADGINYYLHTHPEVEPALLTRFEPWMPMYFSEGSIGGDIERVSTHGIQKYYGENKAVAKREDSENDSEEPKGSNGIAISPKLTKSGNALLLINPHTSFYFRGEVHVVSEEGLNAYGAVTWGQFFVYQGFNEHTGWMHTSTYVDVIDEFKETIIDEEGILKYQYGDELREVIEIPVTLKYKDGDGYGERTFTMQRTHHGPITHRIGNQPVATALMWDPVNALQQSFIRTKQTGYEGFRKMMDMKTNSSNNTVYADSKGNIAYFHGNFIPVRDTLFDYSQPVEGKHKATDWQGLHEVEETIQLLNPHNGWLQNCNSTPFTSALEFSPKRWDYPYYMATAPENFRAVNAIRLLTNQKDFTLESLIDLAYDDFLPAFTKLIPGLIEAYDQYPKKKLSEAMDVLRQWDFRTSKDAVAMTLAHFYGMHYIRHGAKTPGISDMERINAYGTTSDPAERLLFFEEVIDGLIRDYGTWHIAWGEVNRFQRLSGAIKPVFNDDLESTPVGFSSGRWGALAAYGSKRFADTKKLYGYRGNSFVAVVEFGERVRAKGVLAGGQSSHPRSPHFDDQIMPYVDVKFKDVAYYPEDVALRAAKTYKPGE